MKLRPSLLHLHSYRGQDPPGFHDAVGGEEAMLALIRDVGLAWNLEHPEVNFGVGDISLDGGGPYPEHSYHQNGLDMDLRYVRIDNGDEEDTGRVDLADDQQLQYYDRDRTLDLLRKFAAVGCVSKIFVDTRAGITGADLPGVDVIVDASGGHANHFHIQMCDPDGDDSNACRG